MTVKSLVFGLFSLLLINNANALAVSGFSYYTAFSNQDYKASRGKAGLNINQRFLNNFKFMSQIDTSKRAIKRLHLNIEYKGLFIKAGRFSRVLGFYNNISDSPSTSGMAVLPHAPYNEGFLNASFATLNGYQIGYNKYLSDWHIYTELSTGKYELGSKKDVQQNLIKGQDILRAKSSSGNGAIFSKLSYRNKYTVLVEHSRADINFYQDREIQSVIDLYVLEQFKGLNGHLNRVGFSYLTDNNIKFTSEYFELYVMQMGTTYGRYVQLDTDLYKDIQGFIGFTSAKAPCLSLTGCKGSSDLYMGINKDFGDFFGIIEYHKTTGSAWSESKKANQSSFALTLGWRY